MRVKRGIWRLWLVASAAWVVYLGWDSNPLCVLRLLEIMEPRPWCTFRIMHAPHYYEDLAVRMVKYPALAAAFIASVNWILAGFRASNRQSHKAT